MAPTLIAHPAEDRRSVMFRRKCLCDGEQTGVPCVHYWALFRKFNAANATGVRDGDKRRACTLVPGWPLEFTKEEQPHRCQRYEPKKTPGLIALVQRAVLNALFLSPRAGWGYEAFDADFDVFKPMTAEEIERLRQDMPDMPGEEPAERAPSSISDILNAPPVNMVPAGEQPAPHLVGGASEQTESVLDGIFGQASGGAAFDEPTPKQETVPIKVWAPPIETSQAPPQTAQTPQKKHKKRKRGRKHRR